MTSAPVPAAGSDPLDLEAIQRLRDLDPTGNSQLLARLVAAFSTSMERMLPQLAMARSADPPDLNVVRQVAHTLKSSSASLGALALSRRCATLEAQAREGQVEGLQAQLDALLHEIDQARAALAALL